MPKTTKAKGRTHEAACFSFPLGLLDEVKAAAAKLGMNQSQFAVQAIKDKLKRTK